MSIALETSPFLVVGEALAGHDISDFDFFFGGAGGALIGTGENRPYALIGFGYLTRGTFDRRGHDVIALTLGAGAALSRSRRAGQIWIGARGFVPVAETASFGRYDGSVPAVPFLSINVRVWF